MNSPNNLNDNSISSSESTITHDSTFIFGYSGEVNQKKNYLKFSESNSVNLDFIKYLTLNYSQGTSYNSKVNRIKLRIFLDSINSKQMCFYTDENYILINKLIKSYNILKNYVNYHYKSNKLKLDYVNDCTLLLQPINSIKFVINLTIRNKIYRFSSADIIQIYNHTLKHIDQKAYINGELEPPKNPYTNIDFTFTQNLSIYNQLVNYFKNNKGYVPNYIVGFKECYFNTKDYFARYYNNIMNTSVTSYLENCPEGTFEDEFDDMVENFSKTTRDMYCALCFKRHNIRLLFLDAVKTYILNSNEIYLYGYCETIFLRISEANNLDFKENHRLRHRKRVRGRRPRSSIRRATTTPTNLNSPVFNFTLSTENLSSQNIESTTNFSFTAGDNILNSTLLNNNTLFDTNFTFGNIESNINNVLLNSNTLFNFLSPNNPIYSNSDNVVRFNFNSPLNNNEQNDIIDTLSISSNFPPGDIGPTSNSLGNISELRLITNEQYDATMELITSDSSVETPPTSPESSSPNSISNESICND